VPKQKPKLLATQAPIVGPQTFDDWFHQTWHAIEKKDASAADRAEFRKLLELRPHAAEIYGDLPAMYRRNAGDRFASLPIAEESVKHHVEMLRKELCGPSPSALECLLIDAILACYHDYWTFAILVENKTAQSFTLENMEKFERILSSKEARYIRAVTELARVRRLLNPPAPQVNINMPGGQQVNIQGKPNEVPVSAPPAAERADLARPASAPDHAA